MKILLLIVLGLLSGCASMTEEYWQEKYDELPESEKRLQEYSQPIAVCDLTDCIFIWIY